MIEIDGSFGEGGGQILRTALSLAAITGKSFRLYNIRSKRGVKGLKPQHLSACLAIRRICRGTLQGAELESEELTFKPGEIIGGNYTFDIGTAGSTPLVAQTLLPILLFASKKSRISLIGGTHVRMTPCFDYFKEIFLKALSLFGLDVYTQLIKPGFYPSGGGEIYIEVTPQAHLQGVTTWPKGSKSQAIVRLANLPVHIAQREKRILKEGGIEDVQVFYDKALSPGNAITIWKDLHGAYGLGEKGVLAERVAKESLETFQEEVSSENDVDRHLADQLLLYAALAKGQTIYTTSVVTEHAKTNSRIIERFMNSKIYFSDATVTIEPSC